MIRVIIYSKSSSNSVTTRTLDNLKDSAVDDIAKAKSIAEKYDKLTLATAYKVERCDVESATLAS